MPDPFSEWECEEAARRAQSEEATRAQRQAKAAREQAKEARGVGVYTPEELAEQNDEIDQDDES